MALRYGYPGIPHFQTNPHSETKLCFPAKLAKLAWSCGKYIELDAVDYKPKNIARGQHLVGDVFPSYSLNVFAYISVISR